MNRYEPLIEHVANVEGLHPEMLYRLCLEMAGELATLTTETRRPPKFAVYRHDDLKATFAQVITELLRCLGRLPDEVAVPIALEEQKYWDPRRDGDRSASFRESEFCPRRKSIRSA